MVCAICGRMPLMMHSAPISRAAATVFSRCCATSVSTVGTPVMSMIAMPGAGLDDPLQQALHHDLRARAVERADQRQREDAVPELHHRRRQLEHLLLLARDHLLAALLVHLGRVEAELVEERRRLPDLVGERRRRRRSISRRSCSKSGCFSEKTKVAVSDGREALPRAAPRDLVEEPAHRIPRGVLRVERVVLAEALRRKGGESGGTARGDLRRASGRAAASCDASCAPTHSSRSSASYFARMSGSAVRDADMGADPPAGPAADRSRALEARVPRVRENPTPPAGALGAPLRLAVERHDGGAAEAEVVLEARPWRPRPGACPPRRAAAS